MQKVAQVLKSNGVDGELLVGFLSFAPEELNPQEPVYILSDGLPVPFFIESFRQRGTGRALLRLTGIHNLKDAEEVVGSALYLDGEEDGEEDGDLTGWTVLDPQGAVFGTVTDIEDIPGNPCLYVETPSGEVLLPFHEDLVRSADAVSRTLVMDIPDGLDRV